ncbi:MAG: hypothetical protein P8125_09075 [Gemmatimonadota bacterium]|jgi:hypothetical protein
MRKSLLVSILLLTVAGCGDDDPVALEPSVRANLVIDFEPWESEVRRHVSVEILRGIYENQLRYFHDLPQEGVVEISMTLPCVGDLLYSPIRVGASAPHSYGTARLDGFACTEKRQVVSEWLVIDNLGPGCADPAFLNPC